MDAREAKERGGVHAGAAGLGMAMRLSLELVAAFAVGGLLGYGLDHLFRSAPWLTALGLAFGFAAGVRNAVRAAAEMAKTAGSDGKPPGSGQD